MPGSTIYALASGQGRAAVSVVRVSGPESSDVLTRLAGDVPLPRRASLRTLRHEDGTVIDRCLVLWMPAPASYTGEDSTELQLHGGRAVLLAAVAALERAGARQAEPGEFTRRAFLNGRMDLLEAEAVADLVAAETESQRLQALRQMDGAQSRRVAEWAARLRRLLAWQEALIDFPDEDLPPEIEAELMAEVHALRQEFESAACEAGKGERLRDGVVVAVTGAPNVGKSSLVNALARRDVAIVSDTPGTTRDALEVTLELAGIPVTLVDTAGLRDTTDAVEAEGVRRARQRAESADLVVAVVDATDGAGASGWPETALLVANKIDLAPAPAGAIGVSAATGEGIEALEAALGNQAALLAHAGGAVLTRARHAAAVREAAGHLEAAAREDLPELRGEALRLALQAVGKITGAVGVEDVLDTIFGSFCIGK